MRRPSLIACLALLAALALAACGGSGGSDTSDQASTTATGAKTEAASASPCRKVSAPAPKGPQHLPKPKGKLDPDKTYRVKMTTNCGSFTITLDARRAPKTAASFASLVKRGFYDGLTFHRIAPGFVIQGGDPLGNGTGGPGYKVVERPPRSLQYMRGVVAMAKAGNEKPGTSGSQFFIVTGEDAQLPPDYALAGKVTAGEDVVDTIGALPVKNNAPDGPPAEPVVISKATLSES